ncbi:DUF5673 domain-containing protein [Clostridium sp. UBA6640]|uniref:DUF5673 domain-containing protein n=1 Tax=Clostridium sp. UBA6640 TaxID=1946370 RepID=UPI0025C69836|nr:DUF5673 domain-containing protein [Clostridium sp. UBA6640]
MREYIFNIFFILGIILGVEDLISELRKIKEYKVIITKGKVKINGDILYGIVGILFIILFILELFISERDMSMDMVKGNVIIIVVGIPKLITGMRNEIRDDGIYIRKEIYKWNQIETYQWCDEDKRGNRNIIFYVPKYHDNFYDAEVRIAEVKIKVNKNDKEKLQSFLDGIGLKVSNMI